MACSAWSTKDLSASSTATKNAVSAYFECTLIHSEKFTRNKVDPSDALAKAAAAQCTSELKGVEAAVLAENQGVRLAEVYAAGYARSLRERAIAGMASALMTARSGGLD